MLLVLVEYLTLLFSVYKAYRCLKQYSKSGIIIIYFLFFLICVFPLFLDHIIGLPEYNIYNIRGRFNGFIVSYNDQFTRLLYCIFLIISQQIIVSEGKRKYRIKHYTRKKTDGNVRQYKYESDFLQGKLNQRMRIASVLVALLPILITLASGSYNILFSFGWRDYHLYDTILENSWYSYAEKFSYMGVTSSLLLLLMNYDVKRAMKIALKALACIALFCNICIESKRSIVFFAVIIGLAILLYGKGTDLKKVLLWSGIGIIFVTLFSVLIKTSARSYVGFEAVYTSIRTDLFRDDTIKFVIYSILHPSEYRILDYPFQSYISQIKYFFLLDILCGKFKLLPLPGVGFNKYLSCALIGADISAGYSYMTTSLFDEAIANFGFIGFVIAPLLCRRIAKLIDSVTNFEKVFIIGSTVLALMYSPNYILLYIEFTIIIHVAKYIKRRKR